MYSIDLIAGSFLSKEMWAPTDISPIFFVRTENNAARLTFFLVINIDLGYRSKALEDILQVLLRRVPRQVCDVYGVLFRRWAPGVTSEMTNEKRQRGLPSFNSIEGKERAREGLVQRKSNDRSSFSRRMTATTVRNREGNCLVIKTAQTKLEGVTTKAVRNSRS